MRKENEKKNYAKREQENFSWNKIEIKKEFQFLIIKK